MSNDKYQRLRDALAAGPLPGDWVADFASAMRNGSPAVVEYFVRRDGDDISIAADIVDPISGTPSSVNADYIAAADPDTIRAMLDRLDAAERECERLRAERDALKAESESLREMLAHLYAGPDLYSDDGELQDARAVPFIDFKRDSVTDIRCAMVERNERKEQR